MTQVVTPSPMTDGQIEKAIDHYRAMLRKHRPELGSEAVQQVLGQSDYLAEQLGVLRKRVEAMSSMIVRRVKVKRSQTSQHMLDATGRKQYTDRKVVDTMPKGGEEEVDVCFFKPTLDEYTRPSWMSVNDLDRALDRRGLKADPHAQGKANTDDPAFADDHPNACQWVDADGNYCYAAFGRWDGERCVYVCRYDDDWGDGWFFCGVRKENLEA